MTLSTDIAAKVAALPEWLADYQGVLYKHHQPLPEEIDSHLVDWSRLGVDGGNIWKFLTTSLCELRLSTDEIAKYLPSAQVLLNAWRKFNVIDALIPDFLHDAEPIPVEICPDHRLLKFLQKREFKKLSPLHEILYLVPNDQYLLFLLWGTLRPPPRQDLIEGCDVPQNIAHKLKRLLAAVENPYWAQGDVRRYPFAPPVVCAGDYRNHPWRQAFSPTESVTRAEAAAQLEALGELRKHQHHLPPTAEAWAKRIDDPSNYLTVDPVPAPEVTFRSDQNKTYSREGASQARSEAPITFEDSSSEIVTTVSDEEMQSETLSNVSVGAVDPTQKTYHLRPRLPPVVLPAPGTVLLSDDIVTPGGVGIPRSDVTNEDVSIAHRDPNRVLNRPVYTGDNAGSKFKSSVSQLRATYDSHPEWPIVNTFPARVVADPTTSLTRDEFNKHCAPFTVLPDFWKFQALQLDVSNRAEFWKLDFNAEGRLAQNFMPHGAPAVQKDESGIWRFVVYGGFQLHGDVGERLGLSRKMARSAWKSLVGKTQTVPTTTGELNKIWALGDACPSTYRMPEDWDILGMLPPKKKFKPTSPVTTSPVGKPFFSASVRSSPMTDSASKQTQLTSRFPKLRNIQLKVEQSQIDALKQNVAELHKTKAFADEKIKALTVFAARQDHALWLLAHKFEALQMQSDTAKLHKDIVEIFQATDDAVVTLCNRFPSAEVLVAQHDNDSTLADTQTLTEWLHVPDHIQEEDRAAWN